MESWRGTGVNKIYLAVSARMVPARSTEASRYRTVSRASFAGVQHDM